MIRNLIFHIGDPKNGSSSIQKALQSRAWQCDAISVRPQDELNASMLANAVNPKRTGPAKYRRAFEDKQRWVAENDADLGIISAEFFSAVPPVALDKALRSELPAHADTARVIAYVRPHASRVVSSYAQRVKAGVDTSDFASFMQLRATRHFSYAPRFERWNKVFGPRFILRPFIRSEMHGQDVVADFFHTVLGDAPFTLSEVERTNESLSLQELSGMRIVQSVLIEREVPEFLRLSVGGAIGRGVVGNPGRTPDRLALDRANAEIVAESYREDARALDSQFFTGSPMERALDDAVAGAIPTAQSVDPATYYDAATQKQIRRIAGRLADLLIERPHAWRDEYQARIGQRGAARDTEKGAKRNAKRVWKTLDGLYPVLISARRAV